MSGDVQPRKRKDKKRKREDDESSHGVHITKMGTEDVHLHVHHEHGTGGHWCAKIFFFTLLAVLFGLVSLIIMENRGLSDLDTPLSESRFSNYFDGWVDEQRESHDEHDHVQASIEKHDEHDEPFEEEEMISEDDEAATGEEEDEHEGEEEDEHEGEEEEEEDVDDEENDENLETQEEELEEDTTLENEDDDNVTPEEEEEATEEAPDNDNNDDAEDEGLEDNDDDNDEDLEDEAKEEVISAKSVELNNASENDADNAENDDDEDDDGNGDNDNESERQSQQDEEPLEEEADDADDDEDDAEEDDDNNNTNENKASQSKNADDPFDEDDDDDETFEVFDNVVDNDAEELLLLQEKARQQAAAAAKNTPKESEENDTDDDAQTAEEPSSWASSLLVKLGVGVALAVVARLVLLRKNPNTNDEPPQETIMKRRLTIASPEDTFPEDVDAPILPNDEEEYSEEEIEIEEEIIEYIDEEVETEEEEEIEVDEDGIEIVRSGKYKPETFEQLSAMYRAHDYKEPSPHPTLKHPPHVVHTEAEVPRNTLAINNNNNNNNNNSNNNNNNKSTKLLPTQQTIAATQKAPPVFTAPPPPSPSVRVNPPNPPAMATSSNLTKLNLPTTSAQIIVTPSTPIQPKPPAIDESSSVQQQKREITHDMDYVADREDMVYDDEDEEPYDSEEMGDEEDEDDEIEDISDVDDISDIDDAELMDRLEAKYGKLPPTTTTAKEYESDEDPDDPSWTQIKPKASADSGGPKAYDDEADDDDSLEAQLRRANAELLRENFVAASHAFRKLSTNYPDIPQTFIGEGNALYQLYMQRKHEKLALEAVEAYKRYLAFGELITDDVEYRKAAEICLGVLNDLGYYAQMTNILLDLEQRFSKDYEVKKQLALNYIIRNDLSKAKNILRDILQIAPDDGFALAHYGFLLKTVNGDFEAAIQFLQKGIDSKANGTQKAILFLHLGEAYQRLGFKKAAQNVYQRAVDLQLFPSIYQRALYYEPNLRNQPFWQVEETSYTIYLQHLQQHWPAIREEGVRVLNMQSHFQNEAENLRDHGTWQLFELYDRGLRNKRNCQRAPITCGLIAQFPAARDCRRGQVKFSVMQPRTHIWPHCGPTNSRLRLHLGLVVPNNTQIRVGEETRSWKEGEFLIFDDSFEHEVWQSADSYRLVLIIDVWHPDLSEERRKQLPPI